MFAKILGLLFSLGGLLLLFLGWHEMVSRLNPGVTLYQSWLALWPVWLAIWPTAAWVAGCVLFVFGILVLIAGPPPRMPK
jgi:hypothetical protein